MLGGAEEERLKSEEVLQGLQGVGQRLMDAVLPLHLLLQVVVSLFQLLKNVKIEKEAAVLVRSETKVVAVFVAL